MSEAGKLLPEPSMSSEIEESNPGYTSSAPPSALFFKISELCEKQDFESFGWRISSCAQLDWFTRSERHWLFEQRVQLKSTAWSKADQAERREGLAQLEKALDDFYNHYHTKVCSSGGENQKHSFRCSNCTETYKHHPQREDFFKARRDLK